MLRPRFITLLSLSTFIAGCSDKPQVIRDYPTMRVINASLTAENQARSARQMGESIMRSQLEADRTIATANAASANASAIAQQIENNAKVMGLDRPKARVSPKAH